MNIRQFKNLKFKTSMVDYLKMILEKISFNRNLLIKEYRKGIKYLTPNERIEMRHWLQVKDISLVKDRK